MKKLLLVTTAIAGIGIMSSPASAALKMDLGGYFDGYGVYANNHDAGGASSLYQYDFRRDTDVFVNGEATLDNGLTVGVHTDIVLGNNNADGTANTATNTVTLNQVYGYGSGGWGRINLGTSDGAAYLLQVAAPSADSNIDGLRTSISAIQPATGASGAPSTQSGVISTLFGGGNNNAFGAAITGRTDYQQDDFRQSDRITYLSPKFSGFQGGISYAPHPGIAPSTDGMASNYLVSDGGLTTGTGGTFTGSAAGFKNIWEAAARWDGEFQGFGLSAGAGYSGSSLEGGSQAVLTNLALGRQELTNGIKSWNGGASATFAGFSLGGVYKESKVGTSANTLGGGDAADVGSGDITSKTWVAGIGYDNGPYHVGASYLKDKTTDPAISGDTNYISGAEYNATKYTIGGGYTYAPGMTFRGTVAWGKFDTTNLVGAGAIGAGSAFTADSNKYEQIAIGTDIQF